MPSKTSGLDKGDKHLKGPCWTTWLGENKTELQVPPGYSEQIASARAFNPLLGTTPRPSLTPPPVSVHPQTAISAKDYPECTAWLSLPLLLLQNLPLNMKPPWPSTLCLVLRPAVAPPCLNKGSLCWGRLPFFTTLSGTLPTPEPCGRMWRTWTAPHSQVDSQEVQW